MCVCVSEEHFRFGKRAPGHHPVERFKYGIARTALTHSFSHTIKAPRSLATHTHSHFLYVCRAADGGGEGGDNGGGCFRSRLSVIISCAVNVIVCTLAIYACAEAAALQPVRPAKSPHSLARICPLCRNINAFCDCSIRML